MVIPPTPYILHVVDSPPPRLPLKSTEFSPSALARACQIRIVRC